MSVFVYQFKSLIFLFASFHDVYIAVNSDSTISWHRLFFAICFAAVQEQCRVVAREALRAAKTLKDVKFSDARNEVFPTLKVCIPTPFDDV